MNFTVFLKLLASVNEIFHDGERHTTKRKAARAKNTSRLDAFGMLAFITWNSWTHQCHCGDAHGFSAQKSEPPIVSGPGSLTPADSPFSDSTNKFAFVHK